MESLIFFYNMLIMAAFIFCCFNFFVLYSKYHDRRLLCCAIVFLLFIFDNLLLYMNEFLPGFANYYENVLDTKPYIANLMSMIICFSYRLTFVSYEGKPMQEKEIIFWYFLCFIQLVASLSFVYTIGKIISYFSFALASVGTFALAFYRVKKKGPYPYEPHVPKLYPWFIFTAFILEVLGVVERVLDGFGIEVVHDRIISIEVLSIFFCTTAIAFIIRVFYKNNSTHAKSKEDEENDEIERVETFCKNYGFTSRERDIFIYLILGYSNAQICEEECIATGTVKTHTHNIYQKVDVKNRIALLSKFNEFSC